MQLFYYLSALGSLAAVSALPLDPKATPTHSHDESPEALGAGVGSVSVSGSGSEAPSVARIVYWPAIAVVQAPLATDADPGAPAASPSAALTNSERIQR